MKIIFPVFAAFALAALFAASSLSAETAGNGYGKQKVVYHINGDGGTDGKAYKAALRNVQNHINAVGVDNVDVKVVLHGNGVEMLRMAKKDLTLQGNIADLKRQNVQFKVCNNTLVGRHIDPDADLFDVWKDDIVPSGVAELSKLQQEGYTYIKP